MTPYSHSTEICSIFNQRVSIMSRPNSFLKPAYPQIVRTMLLGPILFTVACSKEQTREPVIPPVQTVVVGEVSDPPFRRFPGDISAADSTTISFEVAGRILEFPATQEQIVSKGDLLAQLDKANFQAALDAAQATFRNAQEEFTRRETRARQRVISQTEFEESRRVLDVAEADLRRAQRAFDDTTMLAPFDGRVARTLANNFQNVQAREAVLVFQNLNNLEVDIQIPERDMSLLSAVARLRMRGKFWKPLWNFQAQAMRVTLWNWNHSRRKPHRQRARSE